MKRRSPPSLPSITTSSRRTTESPLSSATPGSIPRYSPSAALLSPHPQKSKPTHKPPKSLPKILTHLRTPLHPLISSTTGLTHPDFPSSLLTYHLLTSTQLDNLARHFHQFYPPVRPTFWYPITIPPWLGTADQGNVDLETKRRRFGRFIGLSGCESPTKDRGDWKEVPGEESPEGMMERMEREWTMGLLRARYEGDVAMRWKTGRG
ncbi:hypothetical protein BO94DRAFT_560025 [Aspergillus sclerotioniger CBS 115572]|uniref:Uncharacterized protein n=1 Tax=Aspergillus sclerotioniger CBS 115572 TaxID=1450535 RepID=A0A317VEY9_9EURO|nr:hypothetical protein BO94DRAFT_560025 [Aspergillus sclerotioniger CBS 115572]PWY72455.1 hypothetical protein BO94DRAFT_560025 [Aspergillus sclerotioniger CBS 115572]